MTGSRQPPVCTMLLYAQDNRGLGHINRTLTIARHLLPEIFVNEMRVDFQRERLHWSRLWSLVVLGHYAKRRQLVRSPDENSPIHSHH